MNETVLTWFYSLDSTKRMKLFRLNNKQNIPLLRTLTIEYNNNMRSKKLNLI